MLKKGKLVLTLVLLLLFSFIYIDQYPTRYPFQDDWIIGKSREDTILLDESGKAIGIKYWSYG